jgi:hypothetical protein
MVTALRTALCRKPAPAPAATFPEVAGLLLDLSKHGLGRNFAQGQAPALRRSGWFRKRRTRQVDEHDRKLDTLNGVTATAITSSTPRSSKGMACSCLPLRRAITVRDQKTIAVSAQERVDSGKRSVPSPESPRSEAIRATTNVHFVLKERAEKSGR